MLEPILHLSKWMPPEMCTPDLWFRVFVVLCGLYVSTIYSIFAKWVLTKLNITLRILIQSNFPKNLGLVFVFCALTHGIHSLSYLNQYIKLLLIPTYPALVYYHTMLLLSSKKAIENIASLRTHQSVIHLEKKIRLLEKKIKDYEKTNSK